MNTITISEQRRDHFTYKQRMPSPAGRDDLEALEALAIRDACSRAWADHQERVAKGLTYADPVSAADLQERITELRTTG